MFVRLLALLLLLSACVPHHAQKTTTKQSDKKTATSNHYMAHQSTLPASISIIPLPATPPLTPPVVAMSVLLDGLSAQDLTMLETRAAKNFPDKHWQVVAKNSVFVRGRVVNVLREMGVPDALQVVPAVESKYDPYEISPAGAVGLWQFMPTTARGMGLKCTTNTNDLRHVEKSTRAAGHYLQALQQRFEYWPLALAAYNCGPARLAKFLRKQGGWKPSDGLDALPAPRASKAYVKNILSLAYAQHTGLRTFPKAKTTQRIQQYGLDVKKLGKKLNIPFETILRLNPELERTRYSKNTTLSLCLPKQTPWDGSTTTVGPITTTAKPKYIRVKAGDSLWRIARRYHVKLYKLRRANPRINKILQPRQRLRLPMKDSLYSQNPLCW